MCVLCCAASNITSNYINENLAKELESKIGDEAQDSVAQVTEGWALWPLSACNFDHVLINVITGNITSGAALLINAHASVHTYPMYIHMYLPKGTLLTNVAIAGYEASLSIVT